MWPDEDPAHPIQGKSFDFSLDDVSFDTAGPFVDTGFKSLVSEATFNGAFPGYNAGAFGNPYQMLATTLDDARFSPGTAISSPDKAWKTSMFFWLAWKNEDKNFLFLGLHCRFLREGFGATIRAINGALECPSSPAAENRRTAYQNFCSALGVGNCDQNLACPAQ